ncbi:MBL fold metallo-hydrolase [Alkalihalobacterium sp. APHAB7]|uniref:MBL fold metallo-hydrolase n=1 Tax=Alkalihalobacterium sp. APHAB7 TaxID=3402081 RepID=UPI003AB062D8
MKRIGPLLIIEGQNNSKVPYSRNIFIDCPEKVLIDCGADPKTLLEVNDQFGIELILNTHYHPDHTQYNHLFPKAEKWINPLEFDTARSIEGIAKANGIYEEWGEAGIEQWKKQLPQEWVNNLQQISGTYKYEVEYSFGGIKTVLLHTPGHTAGLSSPYFPDLGVVYVGDYDMTTFGPWYNGTDGSIEDFIQSGKRLLTLDANTFITGHQKGIFSKQEFQVEMQRFLEVIDKRDEMIDYYARQGLTFEELTNIGIFYPKEVLKVPIFKTWERCGIRKHLHRLNLTVSKMPEAYAITK